MSSSPPTARPGALTTSASTTTEPTTGETPEAEGPPTPGATRSRANKMALSGARLAIQFGDQAPAYQRAMPGIERKAPCKSAPSWLVGRPGCSCTVRGDRPPCGLRARGLGTAWPDFHCLRSSASWPGRAAPPPPIRGPAAQCPPAQGAPRAPSPALATPGRSDAGTYQEPCDPPPISGDIISPDPRPRTGDGGGRVQPSACLS